MLLGLILNAIDFVGENAVMVGMIMAIMGYVKSAVENKPGIKGWMLTAFAFLLGFVFAVPEAGIVNFSEFVANGFMLGLCATGIYKTGDNLLAKPR